MNRGIGLATLREWWHKLVAPLDFAAVESIYTRTVPGDRRIHVPTSWDRPVAP